MVCGGLCGPRWRRGFARKVVLVVSEETASSTRPTTSARGAELRLERRRAGRVARQSPRSALGNGTHRTLRPPHRDEASSASSGATRPSAKASGWRAASWRSRRARRPWPALEGGEAPPGSLTRRSLASRRRWETTSSTRRAAVFFRSPGKPRPATPFPKAVRDGALPGIEFAAPAGNAFPKAVRDGALPGIEFAAPAGNAFPKAVRDGARSAASGEDPVPEDAGPTAQEAAPPPSLDDVALGVSGPLAGVLRGRGARPELGEAGDEERRLCRPKELEFFYVEGGPTTGRPASSTTLGPTTRFKPSPAVRAARPGLQSRSCRTSGTRISSSAAGGRSSAPLG